MKILKWAMKEAGLQLAFVVIGAFLLLSCWILQNLDQDILAEFTENRVSVVVDTENLDDFRAFLESQPEVIRYQIQAPEDNKSAIANIYPELRNVLEPLEASYFPASATVNLRDVQSFLEALKNEIPFLRSYVVHQPPEKLRTFLQVTVAMFFLLWIFTLGLVLFFQLEYLAHRDEQKWSLMKMLGAKPSSIFWPICGQQVLRVLVSSAAAVGISLWAARQFEGVFQWGWPTVAVLNWIVFILLSLGIAVGVFLSLFMLRFRKVPLG